MIWPLDQTSNMLMYNIALCIDVGFKRVQLTMEDHSSSLGCNRRRHQLNRLVLLRLWRRLCYDTTGRRVRHKT